MSSHRPRKRTDLFLLRVWVEEQPAVGTDGTDSRQATCRGRVQRVVDGESYLFEDYQGLTELLLTLMMGRAPNPLPAAPQDDGSYNRGILRTDESVES